jgi:hypothetical protein
MPISENSAIDLIEQRLLEKYGEVLTTSEIADALRYKSADAVVKAHNRGKFPIKLVEFQHRRGYFASARAVAHVIREFHESENNWTSNKDKKVRLE